MQKVHDCYTFSGEHGALKKIIELVKEGVEIDIHKSHCSGFNNYLIYSEIPQKEDVVEAKEAEKAEEESSKEVPKELSMEAQIKALRTKKDCQDFAKMEGLDIPEDKTTVPVIKKWLKDELVK